MKLYYTPGACSLAPLILLHDTGLPHEAVRVDLQRHCTASGEDYYRINPKGAVPLLQLDTGETLSEGAIISQYLGDLAGRGDLMPAAGSWARYRVMEWQNYVSSELHKGFSPLFNPQLSAEARPLFTDALRRKFQWIEQHLSLHPWLAGETFSAADAYLYTVAQWAAPMGVEIRDLDALQTYLARIAGRPAVQAAHHTENCI